MDPHTVLEIDGGMTRAPRHDASFVTELSQRRRHVAHEPGNSAGDMRRVTGADDENTPAWSGMVRREPAEPGRREDSRPETQVASLRTERSTGDETAGDIADRLNVRSARVVPEALVHRGVGKSLVRETPRRIDDVECRAMVERVAQPEVHAIFHHGEPVSNSAVLVANGRRQELVMDRRSIDRPDEVTRIDQAQAYVGFVEEVVEGLVEQADLGQGVASERRVGALQVREPPRAGSAPSVHLVRVRLHHIAQAIRGAEPVLQTRARMVEHDSSHADDVAGCVTSDQLVDPTEFGDRVVVDERDDVARRGPDADVTRHREIGQRTRLDLDVVELLEDHGGVIGRRAVDDHHLERAVRLVPQRVERLPEPIRAIQCRYDDRDPHHAPR